VPAPANLFLLVDDALITPSVTSGALPGTVRGLIAAELAPRIGLEVVERAVGPEELRAADEAFLTNALMGPGQGEDEGDCSPNITHRSRYKLPCPPLILLSSVYDRIALCHPEPRSSGGRSLSTFLRRNISASPISVAAPEDNARSRSPPRPSACRVHLREPSPPSGTRKPRSMT
jgi:hypothetical protein